MARASWLSGNPIDADSATAASNARSELIKRMQTILRCQRKPVLSEKDPEHDELQKRVDEVPGEPKRRALVAGPELAPGEVDQELAPVDERTEVRDHGGRVFRRALKGRAPVARPEARCEPPPR